MDGTERDNSHSVPFYFEKLVYKWLESALDYGITEETFWNMTIAEAIRALESKKRQQKLEAQEKAAFDFILADLIGRSISRLYSSSSTMPQINEVYPSLFDSEAVEEQKQVRKAELSAMRFKQFAQSFNNRFKEVANKDE